MKNPYERLADVYDGGWSEYSTWVAGLVTTLESESGLQFNSLCDAACGTGLLLAELNDGTRELSGFDASEQMLAVARERLPAARLVHGLLQADALPLAGHFDLITCVYDSLNYLLQPDELSQFVRSARAQLVPGGVLLVDINTPQIYRERSGEVIPRLIDGVQIRERLQWDAGPPPVATTVFEFEDAREVHVQRAWTLDELAGAIKAAGLAIVDTLDVIDADTDRASGKVVMIAVVPK